MAMPRDHAIDALRRSIDALPERTRRAMLAGIESNTVIAGAFAGGGGVCPMMAAHRAGGRTSCNSFPIAWDRFTGVHGRNMVRPATGYEVRVLRREIEASLQAEPKAGADLAAAIADHHATVERRRHRERNAIGSPIDLGRAISEHLATARDRRAREAESVGIDWLFEETLVLPDGFDAGPVERDAEPHASR